MGRKFLGYLFFDQEHYAHALRHFNRLDRDIFDDPDREWELLKVRELCQVCQVRLSPTELPDDFASYCASYIDARTREDEAVDLGSTVPLQELPECAEWLLEQGAESSSTPLREILTFLGAYRSEISFWNPAYESRLPGAEGDAVEQGFGHS